MVIIIYGKLGYNLVATNQIEIQQETAMNTNFSYPEINQQFQVQEIELSNKNPFAIQKKIRYKNVPKQKLSRKKKSNSPVKTEQSKLNITYHGLVSGSDTKYYIKFSRKLHTYKIMETKNGVTLLKADSKRAIVRYNGEKRFLNLINSNVQIFE